MLTVGQHPGTNALEIFSFNHKDRGIIIEDLESPGWVKAEKKDKCPPDAQLPPQLRKMSDLMFLGWQQTSQAANNPSNKDFQMKKLEWILVDSVREPYTQWLLSETFKEFQLKPPVARTFEDMADDFAISTDSPPGMALLGAPIGRIISWFLIQHKAQLGVKRINAIMVFQNDDFELSAVQWMGLKTPGGQEYHTSYDPAHMVFFIGDVEDEDLSDTMQQLDIAEHGDKGKAPANPKGDSAEQLFADSQGEPLEKLEERALGKKRLLKL